MELLEDIRTYWDEGETVSRKVGLVVLALAGTLVGAALILGLIALWTLLLLSLV
jgi:hypothetical protein